MARWYALCKGADQPACALCRRFAAANGSAAEDGRQAWTAPELIGQHCNHFIESPPPLGVAIAPNTQKV